MVTAAFSIRIADRLVSKSVQFETRTTVPLPELPARVGEGVSIMLQVDAPCVMRLRVRRGDVATLVAEMVTTAWQPVAFLEFRQPEDGEREIELEVAAASTSPDPQRDLIDALGAQLQSVADYYKREFRELPEAERDRVLRAAAAEMVESIEPEEYDDGWGEST